MNTEIDAAVFWSLDHLEVHENFWVNFRSFKQNNMLKKISIRSAKIQKLTKLGLSKKIHVKKCSMLIQKLKNLCRLKKIHVQKCQPT